MTAPWDRRSPREQARVEELTLSRWLPTVTAGAPLWARRVAADGLRPRDLADRRALERLEPAREADLLLDGPGAPGAVLRPSEDQVKAYAGGRLVARLASAVRREGVGGKRELLLREFQPIDLRRAGVDGRVLVASSRSDLDRLHRAGARAARVLGLHDQDVLLDAVPAGPTLASAAVTHLAQGASITALHARGHGDDLATVAAAAGLLAATVVVVPLEEALPLARALAGRRNDLPRLRRVVTYGPAPDESTRAQIAAAFASASSRPDVRALWAPEPGRSVWAECAEGGHGLHTTPDLEILEVVDPMTGEPTDGDGDLTLTSLGWHGTVLLRVRTGTWVDPPATEPCPGCGRTVPRLGGDVAPAAWQVLVTADGRTTRHVDLRGVPAVLGRTGGVTAWRVELRGPDERVPRDRLVVEVSGDLSPSDRAGLEQRLETACGLAPHLVVGVHPEEVQRSIAEVGGVFADLR